MNHKRYRPAKQRGAAKMCWCNPHQKALGNQRGRWSTTRQQKRERLTVAEQTR